VNVAANLALRRRIDPVRQLGEAFVHSLPEGNPVGDGQRRNHRAAQACATRWIEAGREAFMVEPLAGGDLADVWREVVR
jgi:hypothetical protein